MFSALPLKPDIAEDGRHVRLVPNRRHALRTQSEAADSAVVGYWLSPGNLAGTVAIANRLPLSWGLEFGHAFRKLFTDANYANRS